MIFSCFREKNQKSPTRIKTQKKTQTIILKIMFQAYGAQNFDVFQQNCNFILDPEIHVPTQKI